MELIGMGREADVYAAGPGRVLRRYRDGRDASVEAMVMRHLAGHGIVVPRVFDVTGSAIVMERVAGPTMLELLTRQPTRLFEFARMLADLHVRLHGLPAPEGLAHLMTGSSVLHLDLHPGNVLVADQGPVVIDWTNVAQGPADADVAKTWLVMATSPIPGAWLDRTFAGIGRGVFLRAFLRGVDRDAAAAHLAITAEMRLGVPGLTDEERARVRKLATRHSRRSE
jgi:aminoglycoside phosphotransferase (APT) family kinase protein